uniref:Uncharacterized protein n=1 Tax=Setaria digitata TaxID=48799 RepID=A0A915Q246_9BILA
MNGIAVLLALTMIEGTCPFYMIARPGGIFKLRSDTNRDLRHYYERIKKARIIGGGPLNFDEFHNPEYDLFPLPFLIMDYSVDDLNGQTIPKAVNVDKNDDKYSGKNDNLADNVREIFHT